MNSNPSFPQELAALPNWVCWRLEKDTKHQRDAKVPYCPATGKRASPINPATWGTLDEALLAASQYTYSGIGFMFTAESGIIGVDIDHCISNGMLNEVAATILAKLPPTYIEVSPSGTGLHIFLRGKLPSGGNKNTKTGVEMYGSSRYFTMTGNHYSTCADSIAADTGVLAWIHSSYIKQRNPKEKSGFMVSFSSLPDDKLLEMARNSKDGAVFKQLWDGQWQGRYKSQSEADFALCCKLAFWSNRDETQIDRLFRQSGLFREKWDIRHSAGGATYGENTISRACMSTTVTYTPPKPKNTNIIEQYGGYYRKKGDNLYQLTNFIICPIEIIKAEQEAQLTCDFVCDDGVVYRQSFLGDDLCNIQKFKKVLNRNTISLCFFGTEGDLEVFKDYIRSMDWKEKKGVKALGIYQHHGRLVYVDTNTAVAKGGAPVDTIVQLEKHKVLESDILKAQFITDNELISLGERILNYNEPAKTVPILAWAAGCFIKPHLRRDGAKYPHLFLIGEAGSGKSNTLEKVILPIFSRSKVTAASQVTGFSLMKEANSSNIIPQSIDEFKPSKLDKQHIAWLYNHFRDSYDWHEGVRGRADQSQIVYDLLAPIVVAGEESADESAIRERTIELLFSKKDLNDVSRQQIFSQLSRNTGVLSSFGRSLLDLALSTGVGEVSKWYAEGEVRYQGEFPSRVVSNLACVYSGLNFIEKLCLSFGHSWDYFFPLPLEACVGQLAFAAKEYLLDGGTHNKSIVEQTFEVMARMNLKCDTDYTFEAAGKLMNLRLSRVYDRYTKYRKDYAIIGECLPYPQFQKQLEHSAYFISKNKTKRYGDQTHKSWTVDFEKLSQAADVSGFLSVDLSGEE